jgi:hypothetical protein
MCPRAVQDDIDAFVVPGNDDPDPFARTTGWETLGLVDWSLFRPVDNG